MKLALKKILIIALVSNFCLSSLIFSKDKKEKTKDYYEKGKVFLRNHDIKMSVGGRFREEFFYYDKLRTLRNDFYDQHEFFKHRLDLNLGFKHGEKRYGRPALEGFVELTNYVYWQNNSPYTHFHIDEVKSLELDVALAQNVRVKSLMPLFFLSEAWFKVNLDVLQKKLLNNGPTYLKIGFFKYIIGRGLTLGYHDDLAIDYLGWDGEGHYQRFRNRPPGILFSSELYPDLVFDLYYMKWREVGAGQLDTLAPVYGHLLHKDREPYRGRGKDTDNISVRFKYTPKTVRGDFHVEPYYLYVRAPEQKIEFTGDASSYIHTFGCMLDWKYKGFKFNVEVAGQLGHQNVHAIDRNVKMLARSSATGAVSEVFSHIVYNELNPGTGNPRYDKVSVQTDNGNAPQEAAFKPKNELEYIVNTNENRSLERQGKIIQNGKAMREGIRDIDIFNADFFGNQRFRKCYKLKYDGFMAVMDMSYEFEKHPFKIAAAGGIISGDNYPYNEEKDKYYTGFVPLRSRYRGNAVKSLLIFDRLAIPRPVNISYRTLYAHNNVKDLSNLRFIGFNGTWMPLKDRDRMTVSTDVIFFWEDAKLKKWDKKGTHCDADVEKYLKLQRATLGFPCVPREYPTTAEKDKNKNTGWLSDEDASRHLGTEIDVNIIYNVLDECNFYVKGAVFFPGQLYKDLDGQPNQKTLKINKDGLSEYHGLGHKTAYGFIVGFNYRF